MMCCWQEGHNNFFDMQHEGCIIQDRMHALKHEGLEAVGRAQIGVTLLSEY